MRRSSTRYTIGVCITKKRIFDKHNSFASTVQAELECNTNNNACLARMYVTVAFACTEYLGKIVNFMTKKTTPITTNIILLASRPSLFPCRLLFYPFH